MSRMVRGTSWLNPRNFVRGSFRIVFPSAYFCENIGFRVAKRKRNQSRSIRGSSYWDSEEDMYCAFRDAASPKDQYTDQGFRIARRKP